MLPDNVTYLLLTAQRRILKIIGSVKMHILERIYCYSVRAVLYIFAVMTDINDRVWISFYFIIVLLKSNSTN